MPVYQTTFDIDASAGAVWRVLTALDRYGEWNPQIPRASGTIAEGREVALRLALPGRPSLDLTATLERVKPGQLLTWRGHVAAPWFFEGYRKFEIHAVAERRVRVTHVEDVHGLLAPLFGLLMGGPVRRSQHAFNDALRARAESLP